VLADDVSLPLEALEILADGRLAHPEGSAERGDTGTSLLTEQLEDLVASFLGKEVFTVRFLAIGHWVSAIYSALRPQWESTLPNSVNVRSATGQSHPSRGTPGLT
jgi:hypothetical protein